MLALFEQYQEEIDLLDLTSLAEDEIPSSNIGNNDTVCGPATDDLKKIYTLYSRACKGFDTFQDPEDSFSNGVGSCMKNQMERRIDFLAEVFDQSCRKQWTHASNTAEFDLCTAEWIVVFREIVADTRDKLTPEPTFKSNETRVLH